MRADKMGNTLKHFPGYGDNLDSHTQIVHDARNLPQIYEGLKPFEAGVKAGADSILVAHNIVKAIDADKPASLSKPVHDMIRKELKFKGVVMTDDMDMAGLADFTNQEEAAYDAIVAGNDLIMTSHYATQMPNIVLQVQTKKISEDRINQSVKRILKWKAHLGLISE
jgi:beta-N-acetylhexosaminidase